MNLNCNIVWDFSASVSYDGITDSKSSLETTEESNGLQYPLHMTVHLW